MHWRQALRRRLEADAAVAAASEGVDWAIRPDEAPLPWLLLHLVSDERQQDLDGFIGRNPARVQVDALAGTLEQAVALAEAAIAAIAPAGTFDGVGFGRAEIEPRPDGGERTPTGFIRKISFDAIFWHD